MSLPGPACAALLDEAEPTILDLIEALLRDCAARPPAWRAAINAPTRDDLRHRERRGARDWLDRRPLHAVLTVDLVRGILLEVAACARRLEVSLPGPEASAGAAEHCWAAALDAAAKTSLDEALGMRLEGGALPVQPGRVVVRPVFDLRRAAPEAELSTRPDTVRLPGPRTERVALVEARPPVALEVVPLPPTTFASLAQCIRVALVRPATAFLHDFTFDTAEAGPATLFSSVRAIDAEALEAVAVELTTRALACSPRIVMLPELCATESLERTLITLCRDHEHPPCVLVAGTRHQIRDGRRTNEACIWFSGQPRPFQQEKLNAVRLTHEGRPHAEDIDPAGGIVRVFHTPLASVVVLVCKDALEPELPHALGALGVTFCLVPALTPCLGPFDNNLRQLVTAAQTFAAVVATPVRQPSPPRTRAPGESADCREPDEPEHRVCIAPLGLILAPHPSPAQPWPADEEPGLWVHTFT